MKDMDNNFPQMPQQQQAKPGGIPNTAIIGLIAGLIFPILGIMVLYLFWGDGNLPKYASMFTSINYPSAMERSSKVVSLAMIANLIPFYFFLNKKKYLVTRGIIIASILFAVLIFLYKFVWQ